MPPGAAEASNFLHLGEGECGRCPGEAVSGGSSRWSRCCPPPCEGLQHPEAAGALLGSAGHLQGSCPGGCHEPGHPQGCRPPAARRRHQATAAQVAELSLSGAEARFKINTRFTAAPCRPRSWAPAGGKAQAQGRPRPGPAPCYNRGDPGPVRAARARPPLPYLPPAGARRPAPRFGVPWRKAERALPRALRNTSPMAAMP